MTITTLFQRGIYKLFILGLVAVLAACGGGGGSKKSKSQSAVSSVVISSIAIRSSLASNTQTTTSSSTVSSSSFNNSSFNSSSSSTASLGAAIVTTSYGIKKVVLDWTSVSGATYYQVLKNADSHSGYTQLGENITDTTYSDEVAVHLTDWVNVSYRVAACNSGGCINSTVVNGFDVKQAIGYFKASNTDANDLFGSSVALSADGKTLAVGAQSERSNATGIDGNQIDDSVSSGAVYVYTLINSTWALQAYIKASNTGSAYDFGAAVELSADGNTLAVGSYGEASNATGINGDQTNNSMHNAGATYVFTRAGSAWSQQAYIKASNTTNEDYFGIAIALSTDGNTLAVGARDEASNATGIDGDQSNNAKPRAGAVYLFTRVGSTWSQQAYIKASNSDISDGFGAALALNADGNTLAVGSYGEASNARHIAGDQSNNLLANSGAVYVFTRYGTTWLQQAYIKAANSDAYDFFGGSVALSADGNTLAVGAYGEGSNATGVGGDQSNNSVAGAGAAYVFIRTASVWSQQAYIKASNPGADSLFGYPVRLSGDGNSLAVGAYLEDSNAKGINNESINNSAANSGAVYVYARAGGTIWSQQSHVKSSNTDIGDMFGVCLAFSADGATLAVGAVGEASNATGVGGDQNNNSASESGAVYLY